jgi:rod shape-determining protein MreD
MSLLLAAVGAIVAGLLELTIGSYLRVGDAQPHFVLVFGVIWTIAAGLDAALVWAFAGGLLLDVLAPRPIGSSAFSLLIALSLAGLAARPLSRIRPLAPIPLVPVLSVVNSLLLLVTFGALQSPIAAPDPVGSVIPSAVYDAIIAIVAGPLIVAIHDRATEQERITW